MYLPYSTLIFFHGQNKQVITDRNETVSRRWQRQRNSLPSLPSLSSLLLMRTGTLSIYKTISTLSSSGHVSRQGIFFFTPLNCPGTYRGHFFAWRLHNIAWEEWKGNAVDPIAPCQKSHECGLWVFFSGRRARDSDLLLTPRDLSEELVDETSKEPQWCYYGPLSLLFLRRSESQEEVSPAIAMLFALIYLFIVGGFGEITVPNLGFIRPAVTKIFIEGDFSRDKPEGGRHKNHLFIWCFLGSTSEQCVEIFDTDSFPFYKARVRQQA